MHPRATVAYSSDQHVKDAQLISERMAVDMGGCSQFIRWIEGGNKIGCIKSYVEYDDSFWMCFCTEMLKVIISCEVVSTFFPLG